MKFTPPDGKIVIKTLHYRGEGKTRIIISDTGIGIPKDIQPFLFDKFTRASRIGLNGEKSTGLGMSIVKQIIDMHGGAISCISSEKTGTRFFIDL